MARQRLSVWLQRSSIVFALASLVCAVPLAHAQPKAASKGTPCTPGYVPAKGEAPPSCPNTKELAPQPPSATTVALPPVEPPLVQPKGKGARAKAAARDTRLVVTAPGFRMTSRGGSQIFVQVHGLPTIKQFVTPGTVTYVLPNCKVPVRNNRHALITSYFNTPIADARLRQVKDDVHLVIDLRAQTTPSAQLIEMIPGKLVTLEIAFPPGNYQRLIPSSPAPAQRARTARDPYGGQGTLPPAYDNGPPAAPAPANATGSSVLGPPVP